MKLLDGVKVLSRNVTDPYERIWLSAGTELALQPVDEFDYEPNAFRFRKPWRKPTEEELDTILLKDVPDLSYNYFDTISICHLPQDCIDTFESMQFRELAHGGKYLNMKQEKPRETLEMMNQVYDFERTLQFNDALFHKLKLSFQRWDWPTVARDIYESKKMIGMHFDEWDALPLDQLESATNRICFNLGKEPRYLLFINLTAKKIYDMVHGEQHFDLNSRSQTALAYAFITKFPDYPVIKIEIRPFEAYIAPTENIIHDGSTEGKNEPDISLTTRGFFTIG